MGNEENPAAPIPVWAVEQLLLDCEKRGIDATGCAVQVSGGEVYVVKAAQPAWQFLKSKSWGDFKGKHSDGVLFGPKVETVLCHARAQSVGGAWKNENNHPVFAGKTAVTHNGGIRNHEYLFRELKLKREAEVDSDVIRAILDREGLTQEGIKYLNRLSGPAAIAAVSPAYPGRFLLARSGSPLVVAALEDSKQLLWASRKDAIHKINRRWRQLWGLELQRNRADLVFNPLPHEKVYLWEGDKLIARESFTSNSGQKHELTYTCHANYAPKAKEKREAEAKNNALVILNERKALPPVKADSRPDVMECPSKCGMLIDLSGEVDPLELLVCPRCGMTLAPKAGA